MTSSSDPRCAPARREAAVAMGIVALVLVLELLMMGSRTVPASTVNTRLGDPQNRAEKVIWGMDGKAFFQIAVDPTFDHAADAYGGNAPHGAYRSSRPVLGWLAWAGSGGGHRPAVGIALLALGVAATGALVLALDGVGHAAFGRHPTHLLAIIAAPGLLASVVYPGLCEPLALALAFYGLARWLRGDVKVAVGLFCVAALTRETTLLIPAAIALEHLVRTRRLRGIWPLALAPATYALWVVVLELRIGALPTGSNQFSAPVVGLVQSLGSWGPMEWFTMAASVAGAWFALRSPNAVVRWIAGVHLLLVLCLNPIVLSDWWAFGRITLPLCLLGVISLPDVRRNAHATAASEEGRDLQVANSVSPT